MFVLSNINNGKMNTEKLTFDQLPEVLTRLLEKVNRLEELILKTQLPPTEPKDKLLSVKETAKFLNLSVPTIYSKVSRGELPVMKQGNRLYFSSFELMEYIKDGRQKTNAEIEAEAEAYLSNKKRAE